MKKGRVYNIAVILTLLFLALPAVSGSIDILDMGTRYDCIDHYCYIDYQANDNSTGVFSVAMDGVMVHTEILDMEIRYTHGFRCNPVKTFEFVLNETEGNHSIMAFIRSDNLTVFRSLDYYAEVWWMQEPDMGEDIEEEGDWLICSWRYE